MATIHDRPVAHRDVWSLSWPITVSMLSYTAMTVVDSIYVGRLGTAPLAAIGIAASLIHLGSALGHGLLSGARVAIASDTGARDRDSARSSAWQGVWIALVAGLLMAGLAPLGAWVFPWMGASEEVCALAGSFYHLRALGAPIFFVFFALTVAFQGRGDTRTPMIATVASNLLNIAVDPVLIFGLGPIPALGIDGAALATVAGLALGAVILAVPGRRLLGRVVWPQRAAVRRIWRIGGPLGLQNVLDVGSFVVFASLLATAGDAHLAAHVIVVRIILVAFLPCQAVGEAVGVIVGQSLGARRPLRAREALRLGRLQAVAVMIVVGAVYVAIPGTLTRSFGAAPEVERIAAQILLLYATVQIVDAIATVSFGALTGAGDTRFVMWVSVLSAWLIKLPVAVLLAWGLSLGALGAWLGVAIEIVFLAVIGVLRSRGSTWLALDGGDPTV